LGVVSESEEDCQLLTDVDGIQHLVEGRVLTRSPLRTPPACATHLLSAGKRYYKNDSFGANVSFGFNECIRTACLITGQIIVSYYSGILQTKVPK